MIIGLPANSVPIYTLHNHYLRDLSPTYASVFEPPNTRTLIYIPKATEEDLLILTLSLPLSVINTNPQTDPRFFSSYENFLFLNPHLQS